MGANFKNFQTGGASGVLSTIFFILFIAFVGWICYKVILYYMERKRWTWFIQLCKEKNMTPKEVSYLKNIAIRKKFESSDDVFGAIYSLNLPTPIKRKLLSDDRPLGSSVKPVRKV
ncbi:hypothetical protein ACFL5P_01310 [candidate division KSB1 bacterium]